MRLIRRLGKLTLSLIVIAAIALFWYAYSQMPKVSGTLTAKGLSAPVEIVRDANGVPHIYAKSQKDAQFALGYAHAQDRLWQMEMHRRIANGRMAEILGEPALEADRFLRTIGVRRVAEQVVKTLDPETLGELEAYAAGVNAANAARTGLLPPEFLLTGAPAPEPWTPADSIGWLTMMAWDLGGNWRQEILRMRLAQMGWSTAKIDQFIPNYKRQPYPQKPDYQAVFGEALAPLPQKLAANEMPPPEETGVGSNNWVMGGTRTVSGKPLLANDPHLGLSAPALWYFAHLSAPGLNVIGATLPGTPSVVLGRNDRIAWGFTNTNPDVQDFFIEKQVAGDPTRYVTPTGSEAFQTVEERIKVKGKEDVVVKVRISRHGPIISDGALAPATGLVKEGYALAFAWTALDPASTSPRAARLINQARNFAEFKAAATLFQAPQQNMVYADIEGNIGYYAPAKVPVRAKDNAMTGLAPVPGWEAKYDWTGFIPHDQLPQEYNPPRGYRYTANEKIVPDDYPHFLTFGWVSSHRADRINERLAATQKHDAATMRDVQADTVSRAVLEVLPHLTRTPGTSDTEKRAIALLKGWNGDMRTDRVEPTLVTAWMRALVRLVTEDDLGPLWPAQWDQRQDFMLGVLEGQPHAAEWCDDKRTAATETCDQQIAAALSLALADLKGRYGDDMNGWTWGKAHFARSEHRPFSRVALLAALFDVTVEKPGDTYTVDVARHNINNDKEPYVARHAASLRAIYDLADLEKSQFMHSTGQSGLVFSPLYRSLATGWAKVEYIPMRTRRDTVEQGSLGTLTLTP